MTGTQSILSKLIFISRPNYIDMPAQFLLRMLSPSNFRPPKVFQSKTFSCSKFLWRPTFRRPSLPRRVSLSHLPFQRSVQRFLELCLEKVIQTSEDLRKCLTSKETLDITQSMLHQLSLLYPTDPPVIDAREFLVAYALGIFPHLSMQSEDSTDQPLRSSALALLSSFTQLLSYSETKSHLQSFLHHWNVYKLSYDTWKRRSLTQCLNELTRHFLYLDSKDVVEQLSVLRQLYRYGGMDAIDRLHKLCAQGLVSLPTPMTNE